MQMFHLAGNPQDEFNVQQQSSQREGQGQQGSRQPQQGKSRGTQGENNNNIFAGFDSELLADALNIDQQPSRSFRATTGRRSSKFRENLISSSRHSHRGRRGNSKDNKVDNRDDRDNMRRERMVLRSSSAT